MPQRLPALTIFPPAGHVCGRAGEQRWKCAPWGPGWHG